MFQYAFQLAFTNPLLTPTTIKLSLIYVRPSTDLEIVMHNTEFGQEGFLDEPERDRKGIEDRTTARSAVPSRSGVEQRDHVSKVPFSVHVGERAKSNLQVCQSDTIPSLISIDLVLHCLGHSSISMCT
jgi:hypothetical protein